MQSVPRGDSFAASEAGNSQWNFTPHKISYTYYFVHLTELEITKAANTEAGAPPAQGACLPRTE